MQARAFLIAVAAACVCHAVPAYGANDPEAARDWVAAQLRPPVATWLYSKAPVFKSWADYCQEIRLESEESDGTIFKGIAITSAETVIRRADTGALVARLPYFGPLGAVLQDKRSETPFTIDHSGGFSPGQVRALAGAPPGDFLLAFYLNGRRASNVISVKLDPAFDAAKAPVLQLGALEPRPNAAAGRLVLWVTGPTPPDPRLVTRSVGLAPLMVDGVQREIKSAGGSGPGPRPLASGEWQTLLPELSLYEPAFDPGLPHTYTAKYPPEGFVYLGAAPTIAGELKRYESAPIKFDPGAQKLNEAWNKFAAKGEDSEAKLLAALATGFPAAATAQKMKTIVIPRVNVQDLPLAALMERLTELSRDYDREGIGIRFVSAVAPDADVRVTLLQRDTTLEGILSQICGVTGLIYSIEPEAVTIRKQTKQF